MTDDSFDVTGQDTVVDAENTGTLEYTLAVDDSTAIGDDVEFTITPVNSGLVYATVKRGLPAVQVSDRDIVPS